MFTLVRCTSVKAEEEGDYEHASHGPLGDHFSQLRSSPPMLSVAARAHRVTLGTTESIVTALQTAV